MWSRRLLAPIGACLPSGGLTCLSGGRGAPKPCGWLNVLAAFLSPWGRAACALAATRTVVVMVVACGPNGVDDLQFHAPEDVIAGPE